MINLSFNIKLLIAFIVLLAGTFVADSFFRKSRIVDCFNEMNQAKDLTIEWFSIIENYKLNKGIVSDASSVVPNNFMIGNEWSEMTTSLGSLQAKEISTNPDFAALMLRLFSEAGLKKGDRVGLILSGSFPSLAISTLAALQTLEIDAIVMSSLGASTYGANQPEATWIDMEQALIERGGLKYKSVLVSMGAENDSGFGLSQEGRQMIISAAYRNNIDLYIPESLIESIESRLDIFMNNDIALLINIGGNQASMGGCSHALGIPNGFNNDLNTCNHSDRGVLSRMNEIGVPYINMLNMKDLASSFGIDIAPGIRYSESTNLYASNQTNKAAILIIMLVCLIPVFFLMRDRKTRII